MRSRTAIGAGTLLLATALLGCDATGPSQRLQDAAASGTDSRPPAGASRAASPSPTVPPADGGLASPSPTPPPDGAASGRTSLSPSTPAPGPGGPLVATDGGNVEACRSGRCQILVGGPVTVPLHPPYPREVRIIPKADGVDFAGTTSDGVTLSGDVRVGCASKLIVSGGGAMMVGNCTGNEPASAIWGVVVRVVAAQDGSAVVDITLA